MTRFAAIDVGSYEIVMTIYEISSKGIKSLDQIRHVIALGRDTYNLQSISSELVDELCDVLDDYCTVMKSYDVNEYKAFATSAIRDAKNRRNILDRIKVRTGLKVEVLSNSEQRLLMYKAVALKAENFNQMVEKGLIMADAGSGNSQISIFDNGSLITTQHVEIGALRVNEMLEKAVGQGNDYIGLIEEYIDTDIEALKQLFIKGRKFKCMLAVGDIINLINKRVNAANENKKDYYTREEFLEIFAKINQAGGNIASVFELDEEKANLLLPSIMIYKKVLDASDAKTVWIPDVCLCDGIAADYASANKKLNQNHDFDADILAAAKNISKRYSWNKEHVKFVEKNALLIFDALKKIHGLGKRERLLLQIACILHDCGQYISMLHPEECSYNIIMSTEIIGLSHVEREMVANIVKYTTVDFDYDSNLENYITVSKLTAITKLSNALDRGHRQKLFDTHYKVSGNKFEIITKTYENLTIEKSILESRSALFKQVYGLQPEIRRGVNE